VDLEKKWSKSAARIRMLRFNGDDERLLKDINITQIC